MDAERPSEPRTYTKLAGLHLLPSCNCAFVHCLHHVVESLRILRNLNVKLWEFEGPAYHERECLSREGELEVNGMTCGTLYCNSSTFQSLSSYPTSQAIIIPDHTSYCHTRPHKLLSYPTSQATVIPDHASYCHTRPHKLLSYPTTQATVIPDHTSNWSIVFNCC